MNHATDKQAPRSKTRESFHGDEERWQAVAHRDKTADGAFVYAVKTTGVYCRPGCAARQARRGNVQFFLTPAQAERSGFRACKRCKPNQSAANNAHATAVAKACKLIVEAKKSPSLQSLGNAAGMSPWHFHRIFKSMTGVTPREFAAAHRSQRVREALPNSRTITSAIYNAGFNSNGRFYANSTKVLGMKPTDFKTGGEGATIRFAVGECSLGSILVAASELGICAITLGDDAAELVKNLQDRFPKAKLIGTDQKFERLVAQVIAFVEQPKAGLELPLHVQGTAFQQRVWKELCKIPPGKTCSYSEIAEKLGRPDAIRAVAGACAANAIAVAIPCHRVVRTDGSLSGYRWGVARKKKLLRVEQSGNRA